MLLTSYWIRSLAQKVSTLTNNRWPLFAFLLFIGYFWCSFFEYLLSKTLPPLLWTPLSCRLFQTSTINCSYRGCFARPFCHLLFSLLLIYVILSLSHYYTIGANISPYYQAIVVHLRSLVPQSWHLPSYRFHQTPAIHYSYSIYLLWSFWQSLSYLYLQLRIPLVHLTLPICHYYTIGITFVSHH